MKRIAGEVGWPVIEDAWRGEGGVREITLEMIDRERELLGDLGQEALQKAGLLEERGRRAAEDTAPLG
jgi:hypothetical protein